MANQAEDGVGLEIGGPPQGIDVADEQAHEQCTTGDGRRGQRLPERTCSPL